jgi:glycine cleavage system aminomethyltransferase T
MFHTWGEFLLSGPNALALIQKVTSNDASVLTVGERNILVYQ